MKIYFCGSIIGGQRLTHLFQRVIDELKSMGHTVLTEHVGKIGIVAKMKKQYGSGVAQYVFNRDMKWLKAKTDVIVAEVSVPSTGVGYELSYFLEHLKKPVLALYRKDRKHKVSYFIIGNKNKNLTVVEYKHIDDVKLILEKYLNKII